MRAFGIEEPISTRTPNDTLGHRMRDKARAAKGGSEAGSRDGREALPDNSSSSAD